MTRRVFIAWSHSLFYGSVRLLLQHPDIEIIGANAESETLWREVNNLRPDIIIIERRAEGDLPVFGIRILGESDLWNPRIIHTGLHDNVAHICHCEQHTLEHAEDLLRLVLNE
jgi:DNA-binding NarL/FixJ family response regulator